MYVGVLTGCVLLGIAGASGGYAIIVQNSTVNVAQSVLSPYVTPISTASLAAVAGAGLSIYEMAAAKATET